MGLEVNYKIENKKLKQVMKEISEISFLCQKNYFGNANPDEILEYESRLAGYYFYISTHFAKAGAEKVRSYMWRKISQASYELIFKRQDGEEIKKKVTNREATNQAYEATKEEVKQEIETAWKSDMIQATIKSIEYLINYLKDLLKHQRTERIMK